jgi:hypothetical protein
MKRFLWGLALVLPLGLLPTLAVSAAPTSYQRGLEALKAGDYSQAEADFRAALRQDSTPSGRYRPYLHLGIALVKQNDCPGALAEWRQAARYGRLPDRLAQELSSYRRFCEEGGQVRRVNEETEEILRTAQEVHKRLKILRDELRAAGAWDDGLESQSQEALARLVRAERNLQEAQRPPRRPREARDAETAALAALETLESTHNAARLRWEAEEQRAREAAKKRAEDQQAAVEREDDGPPGPGEPQGPGQGAQKSRHDSSSPAPPAVLLEAADALFAGNYGATLKILEGQEFADPQAEAHANLFRAAAHYALHLAGIDDGLDHQRFAEAFAAASRRKDPALSPLARVFSPRFRDFFRQGEAGGGR